MQVEVRIVMGQRQVAGHTLTKFHCFRCGRDHLNELRDTHLQLPTCKSCAAVVREKTAESRARRVGVQ